MQYLGICSALSSTYNEQYPPFKSYIFFIFNIKIKALHQSHQTKTKRYRTMTPNRIEPTCQKYNLQYFQPNMAGNSHFQLDLQANDAKSPPNKSQQDPAPNTIADLKKKTKELLRGLSIHDDEGYIATIVEFMKAEAKLKRLENQQIAENQQSGDFQDHQHPINQAKRPRRRRLQRDEDAGYYIEEYVHDGEMRDPEYRKLDALLHPNHTADPLKTFDLGKWFA